MTQQEAEDKNYLHPRTPHHAKHPPGKPQPSSAPQSPGHAQRQCPAREVACKSTNTVHVVQGKSNVETPLCINSGQRFADLTLFRVCFRDCHANSHASSRCYCASQIDFVLIFICIIIIILVTDALNILLRSSRALLQHTYYKQPWVRSEQWRGTASRADGEKSAQED